MILKVVFGEIESKIDSNNWHVFLRTLKEKILNGEEIKENILTQYLISDNIKDILVFINLIYDRKEKNRVEIKMASPYYDTYYDVRLTIFPEKYFIKNENATPFELCYIAEECDCCKKCLCDCHNL